MEDNIKLTKDNENIKKFLQLLESKDFAFVHNMWNKMNADEKSILRKYIISNFNPEEVVRLYKEICYFNEQLAKDVFGYYYRKIEKEEHVMKPNNDLKNQGIGFENLEQIVEIKAKYLRAFRETLMKEGFTLDVTNTLISQEHQYLNIMLLNGGD